MEEKFALEKMDHDLIVKKVDYNFLIDYVTISFNNHLTFTKQEIIEYKVICSSKDEGTLEIGKNKIITKLFTEDTTLCTFLFEILKVNIDTIVFWYGASIYDFGINFNDMYFLSFNGPVNRYNAQTNLLEIKGQGCRYFESQGGDWKEFMKFWVEFHTFSVSRFDLAFDDFTNRFEIDFLFDKMKMGEWSSSARTFELRYKGGKNVTLGETLDIGSNGSSKCLSIYNKKLEREAKDYEVDTTFWTRYELRLFGDTAKSAFYELSENFNLSEYIPKCIFGFIQFKNDLKYDITHRCIEDDYLPWKEFLNNASKYKIENQFKLEQTLTKKKDWVERSTFRSLMYTSYLEGKNFFDFISRNVVSEYEKIGTKELNLINNYNKEKGLKELTLEEAKEMAKNFILKE